MEYITAILFATAALLILYALDDNDKDDDR